jgi:deoxyribonuclease V
MHIQRLHDWNVSPTEARNIQETLRARLQSSDSTSTDDIRHVAGVDNAYRRDGDGGTAYATVVVLEFPALEAVETTFGSCPVTFPYVPGLLTFREAPAIIQALEKLSVEPDVVLFDGHGYAHPRRFGLASHLGVLLDCPSIGCAKSRLVGRYDEPPQEFGAWTPLMDKGDIIGAVVRTRPGHSPLFVSIGHKISLEIAVAIVLACCRSGRFLPEPTRLAHQLVTKRALP